MAFGHWHAERFGWNLRDRTGRRQIAVEELGAWDVGHIYGMEHRQLERQALAEGWSRARWNELVEDWGIYEPQAGWYNRGHYGEAP